MHCLEARSIPIKILYTASSTVKEKLYDQLKSEYHSVCFIKEQEFKKDLLNLLVGYEYILFMVDDNIFIRQFRFCDIIQTLRKHTNAIGFSLRLGKNTTHCYPLDRKQNLPAFIITEKESIVKFEWINAELDFGYPLELSSSIYRIEDILPLLSHLSFINPNSLEAGMAGSISCIDDHKLFLLCYKQSITFCAPLNRVQNTFASNRAGSDIRYSVGNLARIFSEGYRVDVARYKKFLPRACHQEVELVLIKGK